MMERYEKIKKPLTALVDGFAFAAAKTTSSNKSARQNIMKTLDFTTEQQ